MSQQPPSPLPVPQPPSTPTVEAAHPPVAKSTPQPLTPPRPAAVGALAAGPAGVVALALGAPALIDTPQPSWAPTAAAIAVSAVMVVIGAVVGGLAGREKAPVSGAMLGSLLGLLLAGLPMFVALEPVWWRFAVGLAGPLLIAAAMAYGVRDATSSRHTKVLQAAVAWWASPLALLRSLSAAIIGQDETPIREHH